MKKNEHRIFFVNELGIVEEAKLRLRQEQRKPKPLYGLYKIKNQLDEKYKPLERYL